jgi:uncharacterized protein (TIGR03032 family)
MPHSPRLYDGKLWLLNSGVGELGVVDPVDGTFTPVCFCPGYARGLAFIGRYAVIGLSRPRRSHTFAGLALDDRLSEKDAVARCGMLIVDIDSGNAVQWVRFEHTIDELYDVAALPRVRARPRQSDSNPTISSARSRLSRRDGTARGKLSCTVS